MNTSNPPGPDRIVTMEEIRKDPLQFLTWMHTTYGPITFHKTERDNVYSVFEPELVSQVMMLGESHFTKQGTPDDFMLTPLLGTGLLTSHGDTWIRQREITQPMFYRKRIESFSTMIVDEAQALADRWINAYHQGVDVRVDHDLTSMALTIIAKAMLGSDLSSVGRGFGKAVDAVNAHLSHGDPRDTPDTDEVIRDANGYPKGAAVLNSIVDMVIQARRLETNLQEHDAKSDQQDFLTMLLETSDPLTGEALSGTEVHSQALTMVMAGHETTAKALTWTLYLLDQHRNVRDKILTELDVVLGGRKPKPDDIASLKWCRSAIQESMRLYPPIWVISRRSKQDQLVSGFLIENGSLVCISPWILHHDPKHWDNVDYFDPTRFLAYGTDRDRHAFLPFGLGPRQCIGRGFAMMEAVLALAVILQNVDLKLKEGHIVEPQALVTLRPKHGLVMQPTPL